MDEFFEAERVSIVTVKPAFTSSWTIAGPRLPVPLMSVSQKGGIEIEVALRIFGKRGGMENV